MTARDHHCRPRPAISDKESKMSKLTHWEIPATDVRQSATFYADLFGWRMQAWSDDYTMFEVEGGIGGGISKVEQMPAPAIQVYIGVDDIPATLVRVEALGGQVVQSKTEIGGGMGYTAMFQDPWGCRIGLWSQT
jgi:hypothetical protein